MAEEEEKGPRPPSISFTMLVRRILREFSESSAKIMAFLAIAIPLHFVYGGLTLSLADSFLDVGFSWSLNEPGVSLGGFGVYISALSFAALVVLTYWLTSAMLRRHWKLELEKFTPWLLVMLISNIFIGLGLIALILPGIVLAVRLVPLLPLVILREHPADMFGDSFDITRGNFWPILWAGFTINVLYLLSSSFAGSLYWSANGQVFSLAWIATGMVNTLFTALNICFSVAAYRLLAGDAERDSEVFA